MIPLPHQLKAQCPLPEALKAQIAGHRKTLQGILSGTDPRKVFVVGPCSLHDEESALLYAERLARLAQEVCDTCVLVMRTYIEKSRTATGWKGLLYDPFLDATHEIHTGLHWSRELLLKLNQIGVPCALEFVNPLSAAYFEDLVSWGFIGARTTCSQPHRELASSLCMPVGFKNSLDGSIQNAVNAVLSAQESHTCLTVNSEGILSALRTPGNPYAHIVLRGACQHPNYDPLSIQEALQLLNHHALPQRLLIDCAHGNSRKSAPQQRVVFEETLLQDNDKILGWMLESHLKAGSQPLHPAALTYGVSITDPCIDWETTEELIRHAHSRTYPSKKFQSIFGFF